ncbi:proofreading thioesterase EntH [Kalamiella sp. sgz302252]|uniref:proofreading thioesterase EntH n=1 Tax=Pantoea sp. sgz302252 TaxID=3341827 RepID=UPI0036D36DA5
MTKSIWQRQLSLDELNRMGEGSMVAHLGILFTVLEEGKLEASMPVDQRTHQPFGLLHGGASVALAETLGSMAGFLTSQEGQCIVGTEINASHHRAVTGGLVRGVCQPLHLGRSQQTWEIAIYDERGRRCCTSRLTTAILG